MTPGGNDVPLRSNGTGLSTFRLLVLKDRGLVSVGLSPGRTGGCDLARGDRIVDLGSQKRYGKVERTTGVYPVVAGSAGRCRRGIAIFRWPEEKEVGSRMCV